MLFGVDEVLAGNDIVWNTPSFVGHFAIAKIDDSADELSHKYKPVLGKTYMYMPDGRSPWHVKSIADHVNINNLYDAIMWFDTKILNTGALYVFDGVQ